MASHEPHTPLSEAQHRQRQEAARARWAGHARWGGVAGATAAGGLAGAAIGASQKAILTQNQAAATARSVGINLAERIGRAERDVAARAAIRRAKIDEAVRQRMRVNPETRAERQQRLRNILEGRTVAPRNTHPVIGSPENARIYDYELDRLHRRLKPIEAHYQNLVEREAKGEDIPHRELRAQKIRVDQIKRDIANLEELKRLAPQNIARAGSTQQRGEQQVDVRGTVERKFRRGETTRQIANRINTAKRQLRERHQALLAQLDRRTPRLQAAARDAEIEAAERDVMEAFRRNRYGQQILRGAGKGALVGAGLGLTAAGLALIAHHVATTIGKRRRLPQTLAKATEEHPETSLGKGMAETFRAWIDRLLGRTEGRLNMGDTIAAALAPGLTQAFADGARQPPADDGTGGGGPYLLQVDFDRLNPSVRRHMAEYALDRIVEITQQQREEIRRILMQHAVLQGEGPKDVARLMRETIGLTTYQMSVVQAYRQELETLNPAALERKLRDKRYDRTIERAIRTNTPLKPEQIDAMVAAYHRRMLAMRAETIARTEAIRAVTAGAVARAQDVLDQHPELTAIKRWVATEDDRTRDSHRDLDGKEVEGIEAPFHTINKADIRWPGDVEAPANEVIRCRCALAFRFIPKTGAANANLVAEVV